MKSGNNQETNGYELCEIAKGIDIAQQGSMYDSLQLQRFAFNGTFGPKNQFLLLSYFAKASLANLFAHHSICERKWQTGNGYNMLCVQESIDEQKKSEYPILRNGNLFHL